MPERGNDDVLTELLAEARRQTKELKTIGLAVTLMAAVVIIGLLISLFAAFGS